MSENKYSSAYLDFGNHEIEFLGPDGKPLIKEKEKLEVEERVLTVDVKVLGKKVYNTAKKIMQYTPLGYTYTRSREMMEKIDRLINAVKVDPSKMLSIDELIALIKDNKYKFNELHLIFTPEQAIIIDTKQLESELKDPQIWLDFNPKKNGSLTITIRYLTD